MAAAPPNVFHLFMRSRGETFHGRRGPDDGREIFKLTHNPTLSFLSASLFILMPHPLSATRFHPDARPKASLTGAATDVSIRGKRGELRRLAAT